MAHPFFWGISRQAISVSKVKGGHGSPLFLLSYSEPVIPNPDEISASNFQISQSLSVDRGYKVFALLQ